MNPSERDIKDLYSIIGVLCDQVERLNNEVNELKGKERAQCMTLMLNPKKTINRIK